VIIAGPNIARLSPSVTTANKRARPSMQPISAPTEAANDSGGSAYNPPMAAFSSKLVVLDVDEATIGQ
jgi:hypothetical protein